jgi:hypothetical protein
VYYPLLGIDQQQNGQVKLPQQLQVDAKLEELLLTVQAGLGQVVRGALASKVTKAT